MLKLLCAATVNHGRHRNEGAILCLRQSAQIASCHRRVVAGLGTEEMAIAVEEIANASAIARPTIRLAIIPHTVT